MTQLDTLSPLDASFLHLESERTPMHMGSVGILEGAPLRDASGCLRIEEVRAEVASRIHLVPKLRKIVQFPLVGETAPLWVDDPDFDVQNHVHLAALPAPGSDEQLLDLCAELMSFPLDRERPLWGIWLVDGLAGGRVALAQMLHHAVADGLAGVELATVLLDVTPHEPSPHPPETWEPVPAPGTVAAATASLDRAGELLGRAAGTSWGMVRHPSRAPRTVARYVSAFTNLLQTPVATHGCSLNTRVGYERHALLVRQPLDQLRQTAHHLGVTLNDLLLTAVAAGVHDQLSSRGEVMEGRELRILVPVGSEHHGDHRLGNEVAVMVVTVPIWAAPAEQRLHSVATAARSSKDHDQVRAVRALLASLDAWPPAGLAAATHVIHHQPLVNLVVTNIPGPDVPLYVLGARMLEAVPFVPLGGNLSVGIAALSYGGLLSVGILCDPVACPDAHVLASGMERCFADLLIAGRAGGD